MKRTNLSGVIFDLDETLLTADINFNAIREKIGCEKGADILAHLETITDPKKKQEAQAFIREEELKDAHNAQWIPGAKDFVEKLNAQNIPVAIVTRNSTEAAQIKLSKNQVPIATVITREHAPAKPSPDALLNIAEQWAISPQEIAYVGDFLYDVLAANNANMHACLFLRREKEDYAQLADFIFEDYAELASYVLG